MSSLRPSSICDTTPLQRLESQSNSSEEPSSPIFNGTTISIGSQTTIGIESLKSGSCSLPSSASNGLVTSSNASHNAKSTTTNHNNNNQNNAEICVNHLICGTNKSFSSAVAAKTKALTILSSDKKCKMHYSGTRHIFARLSMDLIILGCVAFPVLAFNIWVEPFKKGFFCDDDSLKHPYKDSTIHSWLLYLVCLVIPIALITIVEFFRGNSNKMLGFDSISGDHYYFCHLEIPEWIIECYKKIGILIFGCGVEQLTTEIAKYTVGRLRPHFFEVCQPLMYDGTTCNDPINSGRYIEEYTCQGSGVTTKILKEVGLSFPSGHASFSFFTMIYIAVYLQKRMSWKKAKMCKHLLQFMFLMFAWYTALTRVSDYKHHWTDVLAGACIGTIYAFIVTLSVW